MTGGHSEEIDSTKEGNLRAIVKRTRFSFPHPRAWQSTGGCVVSPTRAIALHPCQDPRTEKQVDVGISMVRIWHESPAIFYWQKSILLPKADLPERRPHRILVRPPNHTPLLRMLSRFSSAFSRGFGKVWSCCQS